MSIRVAAIVSIVFVGLVSVIIVFVVLAIRNGGSTIATQDLYHSSANENRDVAEEISDEAVILGESETSGTQVREGLQDEPDLLFNPVAIFNEVGPSVVTIESKQGWGSGFFIDNAGHIITNYHVVFETNEIAVVLDNMTRLEATVLGFDLDNDLAVIRVDLGENEISPVKFGDSGLLMVGEPVAAIGNPFGLERTLTTGIISGVGRLREPVHFGGRPQRGLIQTDAAINPGNSGGPLINAIGEVVGVNASVESPGRWSVGLGFAIPSNTVVRFLPQLIAGEQIQHPWIGITGNSTPTGVVVEFVVTDGPADQAGLQIGDQIVLFDGVTIANFEQFANLVDSYKIDETVRIQVMREGEQVDLMLKFMAWPGIIS